MPIHERFASRLLRFVAPLTVIALTSLLFSAPALALSVSRDGSGVIHIQAGPGERNQLYYSEGTFPGSGILTGNLDSYPVTATDPCVESTDSTSHMILCPFEGTTGIQIDTGDGADTVRSYAADWHPTTLDGGAGNDKLDIGLSAGSTVYGGDGNDRIDGGLGGGTLFGGAGNDVVKAEPLDDAAIHGANYIDGGAGNDKLYGNYQPDSIHGGPGKDAIFGGVSFHSPNTARDDVDMLFGDDGSDRIDATGDFFQTDVVDCGNEIDRAIVYAGIDTTTNCERIVNSKRG